MRKSSIALAFGLALSVGATTLSAQAPRAKPDRGAARGAGGHGMRGMGGGPERALLRGITLTDAQKTQLEALQTKERDARKADRDRFESVMKDARAARQRGDTAAARRAMEPVRAEMDRNREQHVAAVRSILTAEQRSTFDANVAEWKTRAEARGEKGRKGGEQGRRRGGRAQG